MFSLLQSDSKHLKKLFQNSKKKYYVSMLYPVLYLIFYKENFYPFLNEIPWYVIFQLCENQIWCGMMDGYKGWWEAVITQITLCYARKIYVNVGYMTVVWYWAWICFYCCSIMSEKIGKMSGKCQGISTGLTCDNPDIDSLLRTCIMMVMILVYHELANCI